MSKREGICCECQSRHPVRPKRHRTDDLCDFDEDFGTDGTVGEWVMDTHDAFGSHCEGSGTMPQAVIGTNEAQCDSCHAPFSYQNGPFEHGGREYCSRCLDSIIMPDV